MITRDYIYSLQFPCGKSCTARDLDLSVTQYERIAREAWERGTVVVNGWDLRVCRRDSLRWV